MKSFLKILIIVALLGLMNCSSDNENETKYKFTNDKALIESIVNTIIKPSVAKLETEVSKLKNLSNTFIATPSTTHLQPLKEQWLIVAKQYATNYVFNIGDIKYKYYPLRINNWPTVNESIENYLLNKEVTNETIIQLGSSAKGIPALEYLFFGADEDKVIQDFSNQKRKKFLVLLINELENNAKQQNADWLTYAPKIIDNSALGIDGSFNLLFNGLNNTIHYAWETKIGKPAGLENSPATNTGKIEARFSKESLTLIKENINTVYKVFFNDNIISIADKIEFITKNKTLNTSLQNQFDKINQAISTIENPLFNAINNDKEDIRTLYNELKKLEILFTTDVSSTLSLIVTGTDGDGD